MKINEKKWKYQIEPFLTVSNDFDVDTQTQMQLHQQAKFNMLGDDGWELVAIHEVGDLSNRQKYAIFKKEKKY